MAKNSPHWVEFWLPPVAAPSDGKDRTHGVGMKRRFGRRAQLGGQLFQFLRFDVDDETVQMMNQEWGITRTKDGWVREFRAGMAVEMYRNGEISRGAARRWSRLGREAFGKKVEELEAAEKARKRGEPAP
jgi:hypothetical protein